MIDLVPPHGGKPLNPLLAADDARKAEAERAKTLKRVDLTSREVSDLYMFAMGAYSPLTGFMGNEDWRSCCSDMRVSGGLFWPIPITLPVDQATADGLSLGEDVALADGESGQICAILKLEEKYGIDKQFECESVYRTSDESHPGVQKVLAQGDVNLAGPVTVLDEGDLPSTFPNLYIRPTEARQIFKDMGWRRVAAFQTRNPMHRSHEHLVKIAVEVCDGVFIHQVLGKLKAGDIPGEVRTRAIQAMIDGYFRKNTVIQAGYPIEMRYAGPREALLHAVIRQNFGCSHLIVGRDHAGVGDFYGPFDAQNIFDELWDGALITQPLKIDITFYCKKCDGMATAKTCPHGPDEHISISGTRQREMLTNNEPIPPEFSRPEVVAVLQDYYQNL
jgi:sulfate adenylyltransferase